MDTRLKIAYNKVINKHFSAVQTDEALGHTDEYNPNLEKKAQQFWNDYKAANAEFMALLEQCKLPD